MTKQEIIVAGFLKALFRVSLNLCEYAVLLVGITNTCLRTERMDEKRFKMHDTVALLMRKNRSMEAKKSYGTLAALLILGVFFVILAWSVHYHMLWVLVCNTLVANAVQSLRPHLNMVLTFLTTLGNPLSMALIMVAYVCIELAKHQDRDVAWFVGLALSGILVEQVLKLVFAVARPDTAYLINLPSSYSFPSGHSATTLMVFGLMAYFFMLHERQATGMTKLGTWVWDGLILLAVVIALSRIYLGVHWATDVFGGWLLGSFWLVLSIAIYKRWGLKDTK